MNPKEKKGYIMFRIICEILQSAMVTKDVPDAIRQRLLKLRKALFKEASIDFPAIFSGVLCTPNDMIPLSMKELDLFAKYSSG